MAVRLEPSATVVKYCAPFLSRTLGVKIMTTIMGSAPEVIREEEILNKDNPFKKTLRQIRLRCALCEDRRIILGKGIGNEKDWDIVRRHMRIWHHIEIGEDIPIRLLSHTVLRRWIKQRSEAER